MNSVIIFQIIVAAVLWAATIVLLIGRGAIFSVGAHYMLDKEEKETYEKTVDSKAQYKFLGTALMLPLSIVFTILTAVEIMETELWEWLRSSPWIGSAVFVIIFGYVFFIINRLNSGKFRK